MTTRTLVAGAGPGGLCAALALARIGHDVTVLERYPELRVAGAGLTVQVNAMRALAAIGMADAVRDAGAVVTQGRVEEANGRVNQLLDLANAHERFGQPAVAIHRKALAEVLHDALGANRVRFDAGVASATATPDGATVTLESGESLDCDLLIGADGIHSVVRGAVFGDAKLRYAGYTCWRGVAPVASGVGEGVTIERWGRGRRFGIVPIGPETTYWFATVDAPEGGEDEGDRSAIVRDVFAGFASPVPELIAATPTEAVQRNDILDLEPIPRWVDGRIALLGDAAHATTPNMGQGACMAIEDGIFLAAALAETPDDIPGALRAYEAARKPRADRVTLQSWRIGRIGQWRSGVGAWARRVGARMTPSAVVQRSLDELYGVTIPDIHERD